MSDLLRPSILATEFFVRQTRTRFPFRCGIAEVVFALLRTPLGLAGDSLQT